MRYTPNTRLTVGTHNVVITKYISEGGFAHVYTCTIDPPFHGSHTACLKRVAVPTKAQLNLLRQEVDAMKRLKGNRWIVLYIDSHAARLPGGGGGGAAAYEVFLLMEYCPRASLIDFMNTRLSHKLTEPEILAVMHDVTAAVAMCHHLRPPLLHRDIKIENVLIAADGTYKLCDFGSAVGYAPPPLTPAAAAALRQDIMQYTTPQYRAPEMLDLTRGFAIDDKLDVWALGCLLYKLCYYTTPFERPHQLLEELEAAILNSSHTLRMPPDAPGLVFLERLKNVVRCCLREDPRRRPRATDVLGEVCAMMGREVPDVVPASVRHAAATVTPKAAAVTPKVSAVTPKAVPLATLQTLKAPVPPKAALAAEAPLKPPRPLSRKSTSPPDPFAKLPHPPHRTGDRANRTGDRANHSADRSADRPADRLDRRRLSSTTSLHDYVQRQVEESALQVLRMRKSEEDSRGTLDFLRGKQEAQTTGGSLKQSLRNGFRRVSANGTGGSMSRRSSVHSLKQLLTGGSVDSSDEMPPQHSGPERAPERRLLIKKRMSLLLNNSKDYAAPPKASGYGVYTERKTDAADDLRAINSPVSSSEEELRPAAKAPPAKAPPAKAHTVPRLRPQPPKFPPSLNAPKTRKPPPKPQKPTFLKARRSSNGSDLLLDIDDMEKEFSRRFPSKV